MTSTLITHTNPNHENKPYKSAFIREPNKIVTNPSLASGCFSPCFENAIDKDTIKPTIKDTIDVVNIIRTPQLSSFF